MKVLHLNAGNMYGGVETFLTTLARNAHLCHDMEPSFGICFLGRCDEELRAAGAPVYSLGAVRTSRFWTVWQARRSLRRLLQRSTFDAIVCHMPWNHAVFGLEIKRAGIPLVFWQHGIATGGGWVEGWARRTPPDLAISNSRFTAHSLPLLFAGIPNQVIYYPVTLAETPAADAIAFRAECGVSRDVVVIVQVSRMEAWKGHALHLRALAELKDVPDWTCWMVGGAQRDEEQQYLNHLKQQAAQLGIADRIRFLGQRSDVGKILAAADIFCQPNEAPEPFGIVFIEALHAGLPVVTTRIGGGAEIISEREGCLAVPGDARSVAGCLQHLIESPEHRRALGRRGPNRARALCDPATQIHQLNQALAALARSNLSAALSSSMSKRANIHRCQESANPEQCP